MAMRNEPASLAAKPLQNPGGAFYTVRRLFNAELAILDDRGLPRPYLTEAIPQLHTDAWRVFPDGRMETTYRLHANLRWHDGTPFSANDFAFAWHVRRALAYGIDKQSINETIYEGEGFMAETPIPPTVDYYPSLERAITRYPYDPRRTERLMAEAGFVRGADASYASPGEGKLGPLEIKTTGSRAWELEQSALAAGWRQVGFEIQEAIHPAALAQVAAERAIFPAMYTQNRGLGEIALLTQTTESIPRPENRWVGNNRGGWSNSEFDRLADAFNGALERAERVRLMAELARIYNDNLGGISLFFATQVLAHVAALTGPRSAAPQTVMGWNVHEWELE